MRIGVRSETTSRIYWQNVLKAGRFITLNELFWKCDGWSNLWCQKWQASRVWLSEQLRHHEAACTSRTLTDIFATTHPGTHASTSLSSRTHTCALGSRGRTRWHFAATEHFSHQRCACQACRPFLTLTFTSKCNIAVYVVTSDTISPKNPTHRPTAGTVCYLASRQNNLSKNAIHLSNFSHHFVTTLFGLNDPSYFWHHLSRNFTHPSNFWHY